MLLVHEGEKGLQCKMCEKSFSKKDNMTKHMASIHEGKKAFKCEICDKSFSQKDAVKNISHQFMKKRNNSNVTFVKKNFSQARKSWRKNVFNRTDIFVWCMDVKCLSNTWYFQVFSQFDFLF